MLLPTSGTSASLVQACPPLFSHSFQITFEITAAALTAVSNSSGAEVGQRQIPLEAMYIIMNLGERRRGVKWVPVSVLWHGGTGLCVWASATAHVEGDVSSGQLDLSMQCKCTPSWPSNQFNPVPSWMFARDE